MIRTTEIFIQGAEVEVKCCIQDNEIAYCHAIIGGEENHADWLLDIPSVYEDLMAFHANLLEEDNA